MGKELEKSLDPGSCSIINETSATSKFSRDHSHWFYRLFLVLVFLLL